MYFFSSHVYFFYIGKLFFFRFPQRELISAFGVLSMRPITFLGDEELSTWGCEQIVALIDHFGKEQVSVWEDEDRNAVRETSGPIIDAQATKQEWSLVKETVKAQMYPRDSTVALWKLISQFHSDTFPNLIKLAQICLVLPVHTCDVERGFSAQNLILTARRNRLEAHTQDALLRVKLEGPKQTDEYLHMIVRKWASKKSRHLFIKPAS